MVKNKSWVPRAGAKSKMIYIILSCHYYYISVFFSYFILSINLKKAMFLHLTWLNDVGS